MDELRDMEQPNELLSRLSTKIKRLPMPMGLSDFKAVMNNKFTYVDKTLFVKEILDSSANVVLIRECSEKCV